MMRIRGVNKARIYRRGLADGRCENVATMPLG